VYFVSLYIYLKFELVTDEMNSYENLSGKYNYLSVLMMIYNLYYLLCRKRKYIMLSMIFLDLDN